ncbi:DoxX family membrane protein [Jiangella alkaliphila]|uniref:Thiosulfate dehydrogenase [quinone] large subunit n=1 Tax=Jiangella alkaliphila TaxID=419479 RepID=A0A1H2JAT8_9ACTN|nr:DoxX family membrane protein [Jiangella alkaliphila]SDU53432.1 thiosulfate dehydrogenase [quinone] large subunit [Jiangella alkaliphila]
MTTSSSHDVPIRSTGPDVAEPAAVGIGTPDVRPVALQYVLGLLRLALGWTFLWAFLDKTFGLGYSTPSESAWIDGGSPTTGYLSGVEGPFEDVFNDLAGTTWVDWLFMIGLLGIGLALILGIGMRIAAVAGVLMLAMMYLASLPLDTNPFLDEHLTEALMLIVLALTSSGRYLGLGRLWERIPLVQKHRWLV